MFESRFKSHHDAQQLYGGLLTSQPSNKAELFDFLQQAQPRDGEHVVYIHIPFCDRICSFCNMNRKMLTKEVLDSYVDRLISQMEQYGKTKYINGLTIGSIFFGGGTPTVLSGDMFARIIQALMQNFRIAKDCEISSESTLHNLDLEKLAMMEAVGFNRLSVGIQTFGDRGRLLLSRTGDSAYALEKLTAIRKAFAKTLAIDIIYNYSDETLEEVVADANHIKSLDIDSVSFYSLMIHAGSALSKTEAKENNEKDFEYHNLFMDTLLHDSRYHVLELTKLAKIDRDEYKYIKLRNSGSDTIPIGNGAGGSIGAYNIYSMEFERQMVVKTDHTAMMASKFYGALQSGVLDLEEWKLNDKQEHALQERLADYIKAGAMRSTTAKQYALTQKGIFYGNNICGELTKLWLENRVVTDKAAVMQM